MPVTRFPESRVRQLSFRCRGRLRVRYLLRAERLPVAAVGLLRRPCVAFCGCVCCWRALVGRNCPWPGFQRAEFVDSVFCAEAGSVCVVISYARSACRWPPSACLARARFAQAFLLPNDFVATLIRGALSLCGGGRVNSDFLSLYYSFHPHQWHARDGGPTRAVAVAVAVILVQNGHPEENGRGEP